LFDALKDSGVVYAASSEERPYLVKLNDNGKFFVTFDPLDGSSIIDSNLAIGTIAGIWRREPGVTETTGMIARRDMVGAALSCYGSRTNIVLYNSITKTVDELTLQRKEDGDEVDQWVLSQKNMRIKPEGRFFSPGNAKAMKYNKGYRECIQYWSRNGYTLRYSGGMAPDCFHVFMKGEGIFSSVSFPGKVKPKLRFLYEVAPIAFLAEMAGGMSSDGEGSILDVAVRGYDHVHDILIGSSEEVARAVRFLQLHMPAKVERPVSPGAGLCSTQGSTFASSVFMQKITADVDAPDPALLEQATVLLIRHATTQFNVVHQQVAKDHGTDSEEFRKLKANRDFVDPPINDLGLAQCNSAGIHLNKIDVKVVFVSPMLRTC
jgi:fructose-1,6-bisphosphatase